jgi:hypothetical protein
MECVVLYKEVEVRILAARMSDHKPFLVEFHKEIHDRRCGKKSFKFEVSWWVDEECGAVIQRAWAENDITANPINLVRNKLGQCQSALMGWSRRKFGQFEETLKRKTNELAML